MFLFLSQWIRVKCRSTRVLARSFSMKPSTCETTTCWVLSEIMPRQMRVWNILRKWITIALQKMQPSTKQSARIIAVSYFGFVWYSHSTHLIKLKKISSLHLIITWFTLKLVHLYYTLQSVNFLVLNLFAFIVFVVVLLCCCVVVN